MKHIDKKLVGIAMVGLSAWALVIALVFNNTTMAMLTNEPVPSGEQAQATNNEAQPRTLGATSDPSLRTTSESAAPDQGEIQGASITQAPASNVAHAGHHDLSSELEASASAKPSKIWLPLALIAGVFLLVGAALWFFASRQKPTQNE